MRAIFQALGYLFKNLGVYRKFIPGSIAGIFLLSQFIGDLIKKNVAFAFAHLAKSIFATELIINEKVHLAISGSSSFGTMDVFTIIVSLLVLYFLINSIIKVFVRVAGAQAVAGAGFMAVIMLFIIELSAVKIIDGTFGFIPIYDGIFFLISNFGFIIANFHIFA